jgi:hypothetical protein
MTKSPPHEDSEEAAMKRGAIEADISPDAFKAKAAHQSRAAAEADKHDEDLGEFLDAALRDLEDPKTTREGEG